MEYTCLLQSSYDNLPGMVYMMSVHLDLGMYPLCKVDKILLEKSKHELLTSIFVRKGMIMVLVMLSFYTNNSLTDVLIYSLCSMA